MYTLHQARKSILNKWDWENSYNNIPVMLWGAPGIGKTWLIMEVVATRKIAELEAKKKDNTINLKETENLKRLQSYTDPKEIEDILSENMLVLRLAERPIEQIEGVPAPDFKEKCTVFLMPQNLTKLRDAKWTVVFLDELDKASESKMAAATHLLESGIVGDFTLPKDTFMICAGNRVTDSWLSKPVSPELCNRMAHIDMEADVGAWIDWGSQPRIGIRREILNFLRFKSMQKENYLARYTVGEGNEAESPKGFATPRSWHKASKQISKIYKKYNSDWGVNGDVDDEAKREVEQLIGENVAIDFFTYIDLYSKVDIGRILRGEQKIPKADQQENRLSEQYVYAFAIAEQIREHDLNDSFAMANIVNAIESMVPELRTVFVQMLNAENKGVLKKICLSKEAANIIDEIIKYIAV